MTYKYSYYELKCYVFFVFTNSFDIPCKFGCLNSDTTNRKHYTLQGLIEADRLWETQNEFKISDSLVI